jgi:hypothetical protein
MLEVNILFTTSRTLCSACEGSLEINTCRTSILCEPSACKQNVACVQDPKSPRMVFILWQECSVVGEIALCWWVACPSAWIAATSQRRQKNTCMRSGGLHCCNGGLLGFGDITILDSRYVVCMNNCLLVKKFKYIKFNQHAEGGSYETRP